MIGVTIGFAFGVVFGMIYFWALWRQVVSRVARRKSGARLLLGTIVRIMVALVVFGLVAAVGFYPLVGLAMGFLMGRTFIIVAKIDDGGDEL